MIRKPIPYNVQTQVMRRSRGVCEDCSEKKPLEFHHLTYKYEPYPGYVQKNGDYALIFGHETANDLALLCRSCHLGRHLLWGEFYSDPEELEHVFDRFCHTWDKD
jgi:5-methylcytosine-specific restriction endonuclease McrA